MNKYEGIKRANVSLRPNDYGSKRPKIFWRYVAAVLLVAITALTARFTPALTELFKQDYFAQYGISSLKEGE